METLRWVRYACVHCGEQNETAFDPSGGPVQDLIEDCSVCCSPMIIHLRNDERSDTIDVRVEAES